MNIQFSAFKRLVIAVTISSASILLGEMIGVVSPVNAQIINLSSSVVAQSPTPETYVNKINNNTISVEITEGEFRFVGNLKRTSGNTFIGEDRQVRVIYDRDTKRIVIINRVTGDQFYNYIFSDVDEGAL